LRASSSSNGARLPRRGFLGSLAGLAGLASACGGAQPKLAPPREDPLPPLHTAALTDLLPLADLRFLVLARPREIASIPWLIPSIGLVVPEANLDRFAASASIDLRQIPEAAIASYAALGSGGASGNGDGNGNGNGNEPTTLYLVRHNGDPVAIERAFRERITLGERRTVDRRDLVRVSGKLSGSTRTLAVIGRDVMAFQPSGSASRGPARLAALYAEGKLKKSPSVLNSGPIRDLMTRFGGAPLRAVALGPFEGELAHGARGLLAGATAIGASARPSAREGIAIAIAVAGDFATSGEPASRELAAAYQDLAESSFGRLLGLHRPIERPLPMHAPDAVSLAVELDPERLARGLAAETKAHIDEIMR
jgi:hypothetical protein